jgi:hypothetical protein
MRGFKFRVTRIVAAVVIFCGFVAATACEPTTGANTGKSVSSKLFKTKADKDLWIKVAKAAKKAGFRGNAAAKVVAVARAESGFKAHARLANKNGSVDRGWMQFNNRSHKEIKDFCADNLDCAMREAYRVTKHGKKWSEWCTAGRSSCNGHGHDRITAWMPKAKAAVALAA